MAGCHISSLILRTFPVFAVLLEKMNAITVCSGVSDQELQTSLSDRNVGKESYFLEKGKGKACTIKKCFRSSSCNYILPITSCTRCSKCQDLQRSFRGQRKLSSFESRTAHDSHARFSSLILCTELTARARNIQKVVTASQRQSRKFCTCTNKNKKTNQGPQNLSQFISFWSIKNG